MPEKEAWSQSGFYAVLLRSKVGGWERNAVNPDHKTPICGLNAVFVRPADKMQGFPARPKAPLLNSPQKEYHSSGFSCIIPTKHHGVTSSLTLCQMVI